MTERAKHINSILRQALMKDFNKLYVKEFTTDWEVNRFVRNTEINIMSLENTIKAVSELSCPLPELKLIGDEEIILAYEELKKENSIVFRINPTWAIAKKMIQAQLEADKKALKGEK